MKNIVRVSNIPKYEKLIWQWTLDAARELETDTFTPIDIIRKVHAQNPKVPAGTIRSYVIAMAPNHPSSKHHPSTQKLHGYFNYLGDGVYELKEKAIEGVDPTKIENIEYVDLEATQLSLERDLEAFISEDLSTIEDGLSLYEKGRQYSVESGRIDLLAIDKDGGIVVVELKAGEAKDASLTQILAYMEDIKNKHPKVEKVRGMIIAHAFSPRLIKAMSFLPNIELLKYKVKFDFIRLK